MWTITITGRGGKASTQHPVGVESLRAFFDACDRGKPGRYTLRALSGAALASATVKAHEMDIAWHRDRIMFALGAEGASDVDEVAAYLDQVM